ncbi:MAG: M28 family peptidase [Cyanobacteria bacterium REEB67]|nr:M28 family peptidase [Cyanobacteria bacterium REEB67]
MSVKILPSTLPQISADDLLGHITTLASDRFEGRSPGTVGEELTLAYLTGLCGELGLAPAGDHGTYLQSMPVTGLSMQAAAKFACAAKKQNVELLASEQIVLRSQWWQEQIDVDSDVVFVGYGIVAPEYDWDDYKGVDVRGKTVVMLIGDPDAKDGDDKFFKGPALTYYGRWTYKFEIASEKGAAAVLIVHDTKKAGYGWDVVQASWGQENFSVAQDVKRVRIEGWLCEAAADKIFGLGGHDYGRLRQAAQHADFSAVDLGVSAKLSVTNKLRTFKSSNVVAKWTGSDPLLSKECVVVCAHWDHFGKIERNGKIEILSGALDNGSGVAVALEIASALTKMKDRPRRSVIFLLTTLEERELLGARHYVQNPAMPLMDTVAVINFDIMNPWGRTRNLISVARGHSSLDEVIEKLAATQGRTMGDDQEPDKGYFFRSDHLEFIRRGVPALFFLNPGDQFIDQPDDYALTKRVEYLTHCYHKAADKVNPQWDLSGMAEDAQLLLATTVEVANNDKRPTWKADSEFARN